MREKCIQRWRLACSWRLLPTSDSGCDTTAMSFSSHATTLWTKLALKWPAFKWSIGQVTSGALYILANASGQIWDIRHFVRIRRCGTVKPDTAHGDGGPRPRGEWMVSEAVPGPETVSPGRDGKTAES